MTLASFQLLPHKSKLTRHFFWMLLCTFCLSVMHLQAESSELEGIQLVGNASVWETFEDLRDQLKYRKVQLQENQKQVFVSEFYKLELERLGNIKKNEKTLARYQLSMEPRKETFKNKSWIEAGAKLGFLDHAPESTEGVLQLVAVRRF